MFSLVWSCMSCYLIALINAECSFDVDKVELLVDGKPWPSSDIPLYKPVGSNGTCVRCQRCDESGQPNWFNSSDQSIPLCNKKLIPVCVDRVSSGVRDLKILNFTLSQAGSYTCKKSGGMDNIMINALSLLPIHHLIKVGMNVNLNCETTGEGSITYQWETSNINGGQWMNISNSNNKTLVVGTLEQSQQYRCVVSNEAGSTRSNVATVTVLKITTHPQHKLVARGSTVSLTCMSSVSSNVMFSWTRNGQSISGSSTTGDTSILTFTSVRESDGGSYVCTVRSGSLSVTSNAATLIVYGPPTIITHPTSQLTTMRMRVTLNCEGIGRGSIMYQWESKGINGGKWINVGNSNSKTLVVGTLEQSQQYRCVVSNEAGSTRSNVATVTVLKITTQPTNSTVTALENVTLNCSASVDGVTYSWHRVNGDLPPGSLGHNSHTFTIVGATPIDEGIYYCMASKEGIRVESNRATLNVDEQFSIRITSNIETVMRDKFTAGERVTVTFTAIVNSTYKNHFAYQWRKKQNRLPDKVSSINGAVLTIPNVLKSDEGKYYCNVANEWGRSIKSREVTLIVKGGLPVFWRHPEDQVIINNQTATFECFVNGSASIIVEWQKDRKKYVTKNKYVRIHTNKGNSSLTLNKATVNDGGKYRCKATNQDKDTAVSKEAELIIRPEIITNPNSTTVVIGQSVQLICKALGTNLVYHWMKDNVVVSGTISNVLIINNTNKSDEGMYSCVASNKGGMVESDPATVTVYCPPTAEKLPQQLHVVLGEKLQITCTATNDQDAPMNLMFSWRIPSDIQYNVTTSDEDETRTASSTLYISAVSHDHSGIYQCIVKNGEHIRNVNSVTSTVVIEEQSSQPLNFNVLYINTTQFQLMWNSPRNPNGRIDYYTVYYDNFDYNQSIQLINVTTFEFTGTYTLDNLRPYTVYSIYVIAVRLMGDTGRPLEGMKSDTVTKRTLAGVPILEYGNKSNILNDGRSTLDGTFMIDLPTIQHGLFSYLYIVVVTDNTITNTESISTASLHEESMKSDPLFYVAAVVNVSQYMFGKGLRYILGAGDNTTDINNQVFYNRKVKGNQLYFFRIFSFDSTPENEVSFTTELQQVKQPVHFESGDNNTNNNNICVMAAAILAVISMISVIGVIVLAVLVFKLKMQLQATDTSIATYNSQLYCICLLYAYIYSVKQAANPPEPTYELAKLDDVNMENNPAYSMQDTPVHHHYDFISENSCTKIKQ